MDCSVAGSGKISGGVVAAASLFSQTRAGAFEPVAAFAPMPGNGSGFGAEICRCNLGRSLTSETVIQAAPKL